MPATSEGVTIILDGEPVTLRYTLGASKKVCAQFGNFVDAWQRINKFDFAAFPMVVAIGLDKTVKEVEEAVFAAGMDELYKDLTAYLQWLGNGGKQPPTIGELVTKDDSGNV